MPRIFATVDTETYNQLATHAKNKKKKLAHYIREFLEIALKIEEIAAQNDTHNNQAKSELNREDDIKTLLKTSLRCEVESLYLIRCLTHDLLAKTSAEYLQTAKQKAEAYVEGLLQTQT